MGTEQKGLSMTTQLYIAANAIVFFGVTYFCMPQQQLSVFSPGYRPPSETTPEAMWAGANVTFLFNFLLGVGYLLLSDPENSTPERAPTSSVSNQTTHFKPISESSNKPQVKPEPPRVTH